MCFTLIGPQEAWGNYSVEFFLIYTRLDGYQVSVDSGLGSEIHWPFDLANNKFSFFFFLSYYEDTNHLPRKFRVCNGWANTWWNDEVLYKCKELPWLHCLRLAWKRTVYGKLHKAVCRVKIKVNSFRKHFLNSVLSDFQIYHTYEL